jgi:hypothetical protein
MHGRQLLWLSVISPMLLLQLVDCLVQGMTT